MNGGRVVAVASRPSMTLYDQDGKVLSSYDPPITGSILFDPFSPGKEGPRSPDQDILDERAKELTPDGLAALPHVPWSLSFSFKGTLDAERGWMSFTVPVGPGTNMLHLAVHPEHDDGSSSMAMVDEMYLLDSGGNLIVACMGIATQSIGSKQTLILSLKSAPAGGVVVIRMVPSMDAYLSEQAYNGDSASSPDSSNELGALTLPPLLVSSEFMVEVQRNEGPPASSSPSTWYSPNIIPPGVYLPAAPGLDFSHGGPGSATNLTMSNALSTEPSYAVNTTNWASNISDARAPSDPTDVEPGSQSISLGPLVSRGAAPIGPALATTTDDPAPSISRDEQGRRDSDAGRQEGELAWRLRQSETADATARRLGHQANEERSPLTTLKGLRGLPTLVASFPQGGGSTQIVELTATLQPPADLAVADEDLLTSPTDRRSQQNEIAKAGIATRAVGFIIALGLASGPLYPDLIALARRRFARKRRAGSPIRGRFRRRFLWPIA